MSYKHRLISVFFTSFSLLLGCGIGALNMPLEFSPPSLEQVKQLSEGTAIRSQQQFNRKLLSHMASQSSNRALSSAGILWSLQMMMNGANGSSLQEFVEVLGLSQEQLSQLNQDNELLLKSLQTADTQVLLRIANSLWIDPQREGMEPSQTLSFLPDLLSQLEQHYLAKISPINFDSPTAADQVNQWVSQATQGKITHILNNTQDNTKLIAILLNAIYMKARWQNQFDPANTKPKTFTLTDGTKTEVPTMRLEAAKLLYHQHKTSDLFFQVLELPYGSGERLVMDLFIPHRHSELKELLETLATQDMNIWLKDLSYSEAGVNLTLPRFKFTQEQSLIEPLKNLGFSKIFDMDNANFSRLVKLANSEQEKGGAYISDITQKVVVEVSEEGTSAATVIKIDSGCGGWFGPACTVTPPPQPINVSAQHPFFWIVRDRLTNSIILMGQVYQPESD